MNIIKIKGRIQFDPINRTNKHMLQSSWKVVAMVVLDGDICDYYSWFIKTRFGLELSNPLRGPHITFINDKASTIKGNTDAERLANWADLKKKWDGKTVEIVLDTDARTDGKHWWMNLPEENRGELQNIRNEVDLGRPYYGMHMSIGYSPQGSEINGRLIHYSVIGKYDSLTNEFIGKLIDNGLLVVENGKFVVHKKQTKRELKRIFL